MSLASRASIAVPVVVALLLAGCSGGSTPAQPSTATPTVAPVVTPVPSPEPVVPTPTAPVTPVPTGPVLTPVPGQTSGDVIASCELIGVADWSRVGVDGLGSPETVDGGSGLTTCVYPFDPSVATGEARFAFSAPMPDAAAHKVFVDVSAQLPPGGAPEARGGFDEATFVIDGDLAYLVVRKGGLVLELATINDMNTELGLVDLANLALTRLGG